MRGWHDELRLAFEHKCLNHSLMYALFLLTFRGDQGYYNNTQRKKTNAMRTISILDCCDPFWKSRSHIAMLASSRIFLQPTLLFLFCLSLFSLASKHHLISVCFSFWLLECMCFLKFLILLSCSKARKFNPDTICS